MAYRPPRKAYNQALRNLLFHPRRIRQDIIWLWLHKASVRRLQLRWSNYSSSRAHEEARLWECAGERILPFYLFLDLACCTAIKDIGGMGFKMVMIREWQNADLKIPTDQSCRRNPHSR
jgi:hypothetical protein